MSEFLSLNKIAQLKEAAKDEVPPLDPYFPFYFQRFDPAYYSCSLSLEEGAHSD